MGRNEQIIREFYEAFGKRDAEVMASFYTDDIQFSDPVFTDLSGQEARDMWRMLCGRSKDLRVSVRDVSANETKGTAIWEAWYTFGGTGRKVHNVIHAEFEFLDGKIVRHTDRFSFWRWSRQALGPVGLLFGWSPILLTRVRKTARKSLQSFRER